MSLDKCVVSEGELGRARRSFVLLCRERERGSFLRGNDSDKKYEEKVLRNANRTGIDRRMQ